MFDKIRFIRRIIPLRMIPATQQALMNGSTVLTAEGKPFSWPSSTRQQVYALGSRMKEVDFNIMGFFDEFKVPPISPYARDHFFHLAGFQVNHFDKEFFTRREYINEYILIYSYYGNAELTYEGKKYHLGSGDGFLIDGRRPHTYCCTGEPWIHALITLDGPDMDAFYQAFTENGSVLFTQPLDGPFQTGLEQMLRLYQNSAPYRDWQVQSVITGFLTQLLLSHSQQKHPDSLLPTNMQFLISYIHRNFRKDLPINDLARYSGMSRSYLTREFHRYTGYSPGDYIILLRIEEAKRLLSTTPKTANAICFEVGFHNVNNFTNLFKKNTGLTPGAYRKSLLPQKNHKE